MNIGFFGDSYVDLIWHLFTDRTFERKDKPWSYRLLDDLNCQPSASGLGGANIFYAVKTWQDYRAHHFDYAIFNFTWENRLYHGTAKKQAILSAYAEKRKLNEADFQHLREVENAINLYYEYLHSSDEAMFEYELTVKWILDLPNRYPNTKFIFLPNHELSRKLLLENFTKGVLVNFTFESISNLETGSPGLMQIDCGRPGHMNNQNHDAMANFIKKIILNYEQYRNTVVELDLTEFDLTEIPKYPL